MGKLRRRTYVDHPAIVQRLPASEQSLATNTNQHSERGRRLRQPARPGKVVPPSGGMRPIGKQAGKTWDASALLGEDRRGA